LLEDPQLRHREMLVEIDHPVIGKIEYPGNPLKFSKSKIDTFERAPLLGEHTAEILKDILQLSEDEIEK